jgi:hypothetical protein
MRAARKCLEKGLVMKDSGTAVICLFKAPEARRRGRPG